MKYTFPLDTSANRKFLLRLDPEDHAEIKQAAAIAGETMSEFMRRATAIRIKEMANVQRKAA